MTMAILSLLPRLARATSGELCVRDSQLAKGSVIRFAPVDLRAPGPLLLHGMIAVDGLCTPLEGSGESTSNGTVFIGVKAKLGNGTQVLDYHMVADRNLRASGTISTTESKRGFYQTRAIWTPVDCDSVPSCTQD